MESTIEIEFESERLKRHLLANPQEAVELAVNYFEDFSVLAHEFKQLQVTGSLPLQGRACLSPHSAAQYQALLQENIRLSSSHRSLHHSPSLPSFLH